MTLLWIRPLFSEREYPPDERRVRAFLDGGGGVSESVASLSSKLGIRGSHLKRILNQLAEEGVVERHDFTDMEPLYVRFPNR